MSMDSAPITKAPLVAGLVHGLGTGFGVHFSGHGSDAILHKGVGDFAVLKGLLAGFFKGGSPDYWNLHRRTPKTRGCRLPLPP